MTIATAARPLDVRPSQPSFPLAPAEHPLHARRAGKLQSVDTRQIGLLMVERKGQVTAQESRKCVTM